MSSKETKVLIFNIGNDSYAADVMDVERILGYEQPTRLPDSPPFVDGVINYEGKVLPVINLAKRFNLQSTGDAHEAKVIVTNVSEGKIGIIVDTVSEVRETRLDNIEAPPEIAGGISKRYIKGLIKGDNNIIIFLNLAAILTEEERQTLF